ncbi:chlorophyll a/b-binding protein domain-containing protein [Pelagophyceae sp. CCMP2097]|nr:chlorophyll a/b-binding protein domain-containing protein [Pelagophyceae sp. CCMP2097]
MKVICLLPVAAAFSRRSARGPAATGPARYSAGTGAVAPSVALPWLETNLDGSYVGDVGFDPLGFSKYAPGAWWFGDEGDGSLTIFREAELMHGRIAQLACLGWVYPELYHLPGNEKVGVEAFAKMNPYEAVDAIPSAGWLQILAFMASLEIVRLNRLKNPDYVAGDLGLGQGEGRWNPFGFEYSEEEYKAKQLQEIKHSRLAMLGIVGLAAKSSGTDIGVLQQLGEAFQSPEFVSKAGFYFPEGV